MSEIDIRLPEYKVSHTIDFTGELNGDIVDYRVELAEQRQENEPAPEVVQLDGAQSPFIVSIPRDDEAIGAKRYANAQISFVNDIDISRFTPQAGDSYRVRLIRVSDQAQLWVGFLTGEVYTQPDDGAHHVVTLNAVAPAFVAMETKAKLEDVARLTIGEALRNMCEAVGDRNGTPIQRVYIPAQFSESTKPSAAEYANILKWSFSAAQFKSLNSASTYEQSIYSCLTHNSIIGAILNILGWCITDTGDGAIYITSSGYDGEYMELTLTDLTKTDGLTPKMVSAYEFDITAEIPIDTADTIESRAGLKGVTLQPAASQEFFSPPAIETQISGCEVLEFAQKSRSKDTSRGYIFEELDILGIKQRLFQINNGLIIFPRYSWTGEEWIRIDKTVDKRNEAYGELVEEFCDKFYTPQKTEWDISRFWRFRVATRPDYSNSENTEYPHSLDPNTPSLTPILKIKGTIEAPLTGCLVINFSVRRTPKPGYYIPENYKLGGIDVSGDAINSVMLADDGLSSNEISNTFKSDVWGSSPFCNARLRVGGLYYTGTGWSSGESIFTLPISSESAEWHTVTHRGQVSYNCIGEEGFYILMDHSEYGTYEFDLGVPEGSYESAPPYGAGVIIPDVDIKDFSISYAPNFNVVTLPFNSAISRDFGRKWGEVREVQLSLHGSLEGITTSTALQNSRGENVVAVNKVGAYSSLEEALLRSYEKHYASTLESRRRGLRQMNIRPIDIVVNDNVYSFVAGGKINYAEGTMELNLVKIKQ